MVNGVLNIVAAVLFAVVALKDGYSQVWMIIAGVYLLAGLVDLIIHAVKVHRMKRAAKKAEEAGSRKETPKPAEAETTVGE